MLLGSRRPTASRRKARESTRGYRRYSGRLIPRSQPQAGCNRRVEGSSAGRLSSLPMRGLDRDRRAGARPSAGALFLLHAPAPSADAAPIHERAAFFRPAARRTRAAGGSITRRTCVLCAATLSKCEVKSFGPLGAISYVRIETQLKCQKR